MRRALVLVVMLAASCGALEPVTLSNLRCDGSCQATDDPFTMTLAVDYQDPGGVLKTSRLAFTLDGVVDAGTARVSTFVAEPAASGTLRFTVPVKLSSVQDQETFTLGVRVETPSASSNEVAKEFEIQL